MTNQKDDDPTYKVGYGKPPLKTRFRKGTSGNPRGRRPMIERSRTKLQQQLDFLTIAEQPINVNLNGRHRRISGFQAVILKLQQKAINGDAKAMALYLGTAKEVMDGFVTGNSATALVEMFHRNRLTQPDPLDPDTISEINKLNRKTRS